MTVEQEPLRQPVVNKMTTVIRRYNLTRRKILLGSSVLGLIIALIGAVPLVVYQGDTVTSVAEIDNPGLVTTGVDGLMNGRPGAVTIRASVEGDSPVMIGVGRFDDVMAWADGLPGSEITDFNAKYTKYLISRPRVSGSNATEGGVPNPIDSDLWVHRKSANGTVELKFDPPKGQWAFITGGDGNTAGPNKVELIWPSTSRTPWAPWFVGIGLFFAVFMYALDRYLKLVGRSPAPPSDSEFDDIDYDDIDYDDTDYQEIEIPRFDTEPEGHVNRRLSERKNRLSTVVRFAAAATLATAVTGCADAGQLQPGERPDVVPVVEDSQVSRALSGIEKAIATADEEKNDAPLKSRVAGAELEKRQAQYLLADRGQLAAPLPGLSTVDMRAIVPTNLGFPRYVMATTQADPGEVPMVHVLVQNTARENYQLVARAEMLPGEKFPRLFDSDDGNPTLDPSDGSGLKASPNDALKRYTEILSSPQSEDREDFASDKFSADIVKQQGDEGNTVKSSCSDCFSYEVKHELREGSVWAVRGKDDEALVIGIINGSRHVKIKTSGAILPLTSDLGALAGTEEAGDSVAINQVEIVVLKIPEASSDEKIRVVGASRTLTGVQVGNAP